MLTLDEVIKAYEIHINPEAGRCITDCPYHGECVPNEEMKDALHYLKELRYILDNLVWVKPEEKGHWEIRSLLPEDDERTEK